MSGVSPIMEEWAELDAQSRRSYTPTVEQRKIATYVQHQVATSREAQRNDAVRTILRMMFWLGRQWDDVDLNGLGARLIDRQIVDDDRVVYNYVRAAVNSMVARLTENKPIVTVSPSTTDEDDREKARGCNHLVDHLWENLELQEDIKECVQWMVIAGLGTLKVSWDPTLGDPQETEDTSEEAQGVRAAGIEVPPRTTKPGGLVGEALSPDEWGRDPGAKKMKNARWAWHEAILHIDEIRERWPEFGMYVVPDAGLTRDRFTTTSLRNLYDPTDARPKDRARVIEYFERPSPRRPQGRYAVVSGDVTLQAEDVLPLGELPFIVARHNAVPGKLHGDGAVEDLFTPQKQINEKNAQRKATTDRMANPPWIAPLGSLVNGEPEGVPAELIEFNPRAGPPPRQAQVPPLPREHGEIASENVTHIFEIAGITDLARGRIPSGLSGRSIGMATDLEASLLGPTIRELQKLVRQLAIRMLTYWRRYCPLPVTLRVMGRGRLSETIEFHASDVPFDLDVKVSEDSMLPRHKSYKREQTLMFIERGMYGDVVNDPKARAKAWKSREFGEIDDEDDTDGEKIYAREEHAVFLGAVERWVAEGAIEGTFVAPLGVRADEDHATHEDVHSEWSLTGDFRRLPPECQRAFLAHRAEHSLIAWKAAQGQDWWVEFLSPERRAEWDAIQLAQVQPPQIGAPPPGGGALPRSDAFGPDPAVLAPGVAPTGDPNQAIAFEEMNRMMASQQAPFGLDAGLSFGGHQQGGPLGPGLPSSGYEQGM